MPLRNKLVQPGGLWSDREHLPVWPTLRNARLTPEAMDNLEPLFSLVCIRGTYQTRLNGVPRYTSEATEPVMIGEVTMRVMLSQDSHDSIFRKPSTLHTLLMLTQIQTSVIFHMGWQYPHMICYDKENLQKAACILYARVAIRLYERQADDVPPDVNQFVNRTLGWDVR